jgi:cellulose synthase (UDP-forming)
MALEAARMRRINRAPRRVGEAEQIERWRCAAAALVRWAAVIAGVVLLAVAIVVPLGLHAQVAFAAAVFGIGVVVSRSASPLATTVLAVGSMAVSARYVGWRLTTIGTAALDLETGLGALLLAAEAYALLTLGLGYLQSVATLRRAPAPLPPDPSTWPTVDVFIPTFSEPLEVVRATVLAARSLDWPRKQLRVWLLDDGRRPAFRAFAAQAGVGYLTRPDNAHAKAGNINAALRRTRGDFVAVFDCDHVPTRSFLQLTMGWFLRDRRLALVQTPHHFYSPDPFERNLGNFRQVPNEGELFYGLIQPANDLWNAAFFCGSCAVLRRSALEAVGGIAVETVTEDAHTALRLHRAGHRSAYLSVPQAAGLATDTLSAHIGQRIRWARGMAQIFRIENPLLGRGLTLAQRLCYLAAMLHFFSGIPRIVFLVAPLWYLFFGLHVFNALPIVTLAYALPHIAHAVVANVRIQRRYRRAFWSQVYETCLSFYLVIPTTLALVDPKAGRFNVTAKGGLTERTYFDWRIVRPHLALTGLLVAGLAVGACRLWAGIGEPDAVAVNMLWSCYSLALIGATLLVARERRQVRTAPRVSVRLPALLQLASGHTVAAQTVDLSRGGARLAASTARALSRGEKVWLSFLGIGDEHPVSAEVVTRDQTKVQVRFADLTLDEEAALVGALFGRSDAWTNWIPGRPQELPARSPGDVAHPGAVDAPWGAEDLQPAPALAPVPLSAAVRSGA